ncbi:MAG: efflux transporter outer membrane subunit [Candidatus Berkiellales bacterium]
MLAAKQMAFIILVNITLASCTVGPNFHHPKSTEKRYVDVTLPGKTVHSAGQGGKAQTFAMGKEIPAKWWELFHSPALNQLIILGFANSPTVAAAQAALCQAQENLTAQIGTTLFPTINAQGSGSRERFSPETFGAPNASSTTFNLFNTQLNISYALDLFGGGRRQIEATSALVNYQQYLLEGTYLTLAANIVTTAITEASLREQIQATQDLIRLEEDLLKIIKQQYTLGAIAKSDVLSQESQVAQIRATLPPLDKSLALTRHTLSLLIGAMPTENVLPKFFLNQLHLPGELPLSLPSKLIEQRPDVRANEALLHQASANIGVATANLLPQFNLTGYYGWDANQLGSLFSDKTSIWNLTGQVLQPIFQGGALLAKRRAAIAAYQQAAAQYRQTVLQAFQNVADTLRAIEIDSRTLKAETEALVAAKDLLTLTEAQFKLGAVTYLSLLNAQSQYQQALINRIKAEASRYTDTAALFQALGGGWWHE